MSIFYEAARTYLAEAHDNILNEDGTKEYATLSAEDRNRFDAMVEDQAGELVNTFRSAAESFMADADRFEAEA